MQLSLLLLLLPVSVFCGCYIGVGYGDDNNGVYAKLPCGDGDQYCYKLDIYVAIHTVTKSCGYGLCSSTGCHDTATGRECCCKGDYCNTAAGSSLLVTSLTVVSAFLLRF